MGICSRFWDYDDIFFRAPTWERHQGLDQYESKVNQWTLDLKGIGLAKSFVRAHPTMRKAREHMNEPKKTAIPIPRNRQKIMSRQTNPSHAEKYRVFNLITFARNLGKEQKTDRHQVAKGKKDNSHKQRGHYSVSHITKLLRTKNLGEEQKKGRHQIAKGKKSNSHKQSRHYSVSHIIKLLSTRNLGEKHKTDRHKVKQGKKENRLQQQSGHYTTSHIRKLLRKKSREYVRVA